jgi:hypothetical protein
MAIIETTTFRLGNNIRLLRRELKLSEETVVAPERGFVVAQGLIPELRVANDGLEGDLIPFGQVSAHIFGKEVTLEQVRLEGQQIDFLDHVAHFGPFTRVTTYSHRED